MNTEGKKKIVSNENWNSTAFDIRESEGSETLNTSYGGIIEDWEPIKDRVPLAFDIRESEGSETLNTSYGGIIEDWESLVPNIGNLMRKKLKD